MTRKKFVFTDLNGERWITPEFNGDKNEFKQSRSKDICVITWDELIALFSGDVTKEDFEQSCFNAQRCYESHISGPAIPLSVEPFIPEYHEKQCNDIYYLNGRYSSLSFNWRADRENKENGIYVLQVIVQCCSPADAKRILTRIQYELYSDKYAMEMDEILVYSIDMWTEFIFTLNDESANEHKNEIEVKLDLLINSPDFYQDTAGTFMNAIVDKAKEKGLYEKYSPYIESFMPNLDPHCTIANYNSVFLSSLDSSIDTKWLSIHLYNANNLDDSYLLGDFVTTLQGIDSAMLLGELGGLLVFLGYQYMRENSTKYDDDM